MSKYLNHNATLQCTHGGQVMMMPPPMRSLWIMESPVVTDVDLYSAFIIGCPQIGPGLTPCINIVSILMGLAIQIEVDGETPILSSLQALTDGCPPGFVSALDDGGSNAEPAPFSIAAATMSLAAKIGAALCPSCIGSPSGADAGAGAPGAPGAGVAAGGVGAAALAGTAPGGAGPVGGPGGAGASGQLAALKHGREMALLAKDSYKSSGAPPGYTRLNDDPKNLPDGLKDFKFNDPSSGFDSALYQTPDGRVVIAYRGTEPTQMGDLSADAKQAFGFHSDQYDDSVKLARLVQQSYPDKQVEITGHSLGGGLAAVASDATGYPATTFNAAGVNDRTMDRYDLAPSDNITNYRLGGDPLTGVQEHVPLLPTAQGTQVNLPAVTADGQPISANPMAHHSIDSFDGAFENQMRQQGGGQ